MTAVVPRITAVSGFVSVPSISVGQNVGVNDILAITVLTNLNAANSALHVPIILPAIVTQDGSPIKAKITTGAVAASMTVAFDLIGYLI